MRKLTRRQAVRAFGLVGSVTLVGCGKDATATSPTSPTSTTSDASLTALVVSEVTLSPTFSTTTTTYTASAASSVATVTVTATAAASGSKVAVNGTVVASGAASTAVTLGAGTTTLTIVVTAADGSTTAIACGMLTLALASLGLFAVMSYIVVQQRREIGIRMALGARPGDVVRMVLRRGLLDAAVGIGLGIICSLWLVTVLARFLYGIRPFEPQALLGVSAVVLVVAALAACVPALRASVVDPLIVTKSE